VREYSRYVLGALRGQSSGPVPLYSSGTPGVAAHRAPSDTDGPRLPAPPQPRSAFSAPLAVWRQTERTGPLRFKPLTPAHADQQSEGDEYHLGHAAELLQAHTHAHTHAQAHRRRHAHTHVHTHACARARTHACVRAHTRARSRAHARMRARVHTHTHTQLRTRTHTRIVQTRCAHPHKHARACSVRA
jgi:hypothetical protein